MKGIILAGGRATRLRPSSLITNKHLFNVYDRPMIEYPIATLVGMGIDEILIVSGEGHAGQFLEYLSDGSDRGLKFSYVVQKEAGGIAQAIGLAESFVDGGKFAVILGDNIFEDGFAKEWERFVLGRHECCLFLKETDSPNRFGVFDPATGRITEKPEVPPSNMAVTGLYFYDEQVFGCIRDLKPSGRGELEITDVNNWYADKGLGKVNHHAVKGFWSDAGTFGSLMVASNWAWKSSKSFRG